MGQPADYENELTKNYEHKEIDDSGQLDNEAQELKKFGFAYICTVVNGHNLKNIARYAGYEPSQESDFFV